MRGLEVIHVSGYDLVVEETAHPSNQNKSILLSRNHPIAVVVGSAGFLGSYLTEKLLGLGVQVIGIDNFSTSRKENLIQSFKHKNFHFLHQSIEEDSVEGNLSGLPHLDYAIFIAENPVNSSLYKNGLQIFLKIVKSFKKGEDNSKTEKPKVVFVSSIQIYDNSPESNLNYLKSAENQFAKFIKNHGLNGRVVRLSEVYGPRMHFRENQPISRLIKASLEGKLAKEETALDFSTRSLFIDDAVALILKSVLSGSTSGKIYDGCLVQPIKIAEIKQILLNPHWHLERGFLPTELPPWPTPNLDRSIRELAWKPKSHLVKTLKETVEFFDTDEEAKKFALNQKKQLEQEKIKGWSFSNIESSLDEKSLIFKRKKGFKFSLILAPVILFLIFYPLISFIVGAYSLPANLNNIRQAVGAGDLNGAKRSLQITTISNQQMNNLQPILSVLNNSGLIGESSRQISNLLKAQSEGIEGINQSLEAIAQSSKIILQGGSGNINANSFLSAQNHLSASLIILADDRLKNSWYIPNKSGLVEPTNYQYFYDLSQKGQGISRILPVLFSSPEKNYLLQVFDSNYLQPPVGKISQIGELKFKTGVISIGNLKSLGELDQQLAQKNIQLSRNNISSKAQFSEVISADFSTYAQIIKALYQSLNPSQFDGVIAVDKNVISQMAVQTGINLETDQSLSQLLGTLLNEQNLLKSVQIFDQALNQKRMLIYSSDNNLQSLINNLGWTGSIKSPVKEEGMVDFLAVVENNHNQTPSNQTERKFLLQTAISQDGGVSHVLTINYINTQPDHSSLQLILPLGSRLTGAKAGESNIPFSGSVDFGRAVYSGEINLNPGPTSVIFEYNLAKKVEVGEQGGSYSLKINKQVGTGNEQLNWQINYPFSWDLVSKVKGVDTTKHQISVQIVLDADKSFDLTFKKH